MSAAAGAVLAAPRLSSRCLSTTALGQRWLTQGSGSAVAAHRQAVEALRKRSSSSDSGGAAAAAIAVATKEMAYGAQASEVVAAPPSLVALTPRGFRRSDSLFAAASPVAVTAPPMFVAAPALPNAVRACSRCCRRPPVACRCSRPLGFQSASFVLISAPLCLSLLPPWG